MTEPSTLGIATWNIHMGVGRDGKRDLDRIAEVIVALDVDCIALQEVDNRFITGEIGELAILCRKTGYEAISGPTLHRPDGDYGNALLTRLPVRKTRREDLSVGEFEPRGLIDVDLQRGRRTIRVVATHLGLRSAERRKQIAFILRHLESCERGPTILLGDFNEWWPWSRNLRRLQPPFGNTPAVPTFPARLPIFALDRILVTPELCIRSLRTVKEPSARRASDHLPLKAVVD